MGISPVTRPCCHVEQLPRAKKSVCVAPLAAMRARIQEGYLYVDQYEVVEETREKMDLATSSKSVESKPNDKAKPCRVFDVRCKSNGLLYVCRRVPKADIPRQTTDDLLKRHVAALCGLSHPHLCNVVECFDDRKDYVFIYELAYGPHLMDFLKKTKDEDSGGHKRVPELIRQILSALACAHDRGIVHGRLEPSTLLLAAADGGGRQRRGEAPGVAQVKIRDIGQGFVFRPPLGQAGQVVFDHSVIAHAAPETVDLVWGEDAARLRNGLPKIKDMDAVDDMTELPKGIAPKGAASVDIWSVGVIAYRMIANDLPFRKQNGEAMTATDLFTAVCTQPVTLKGKAWNDSRAKDAVSSMLRMNGNLRPTARELLKHEWLKIPRDDVSAQTLRGLFQNAILNLQEGLFKKSVIRMMVELMPSGYGHVDDALEAFRSLDRDRDGLLSSEEFKAAVKRFPELQKMMDKSEYWDEDSLFESADRTCTGALSPLDFLAATFPPKLAREEKWLWQAFRAFDQDEDGEITVEEVVNAVMILDGSLTSKEQLKELNETLTTELSSLSFSPNANSSEQFRPKPREQLEEEIAADAEAVQQAVAAAANGEQVEMPKVTSAIWRRLENRWLFFRQRFCPPYRTLDFGEFVYLCGAGPRDYHCPYNLLRLCRKEGAYFAEYCFDMDLYPERRDAVERDVDFPPKPGASAKCPRSIYQKRDGLLGTRSRKQAGKSQKKRADGDSD